MLSGSRARLSRSSMVVPGIGRDFAGVPARRVAVPALRTAHPASRAGRAFDILLQALPEIGGRPEIQTQFNSTTTGDWRESTCSQETPTPKKTAFSTPP